MGHSQHARSHESALTTLTTIDVPPGTAVLIIGARGQLGSELVHAWAGHPHVVHCDRRMLDITNFRHVMQFVGALQPRLILNAAGYNDVDAAEEDPAQAFNVNSFAVRSLARAASACGARLVHFSSDFVFDGNTSRPYSEDDAPAPASTYAASKLVGEWFARDAGSGFVLRVESLFGSFPHSARRRGSIDRIIDALERGEPVKAFRDRTVSPSYVLDVAQATAHLVDSGAPSGTYHVVNSGYCTWFELAMHVAGQLGVEARIEPVAMADLSLRAPRPRFAALSNRRLADAGWVMPSWQDALAHYLAHRRHVSRSRPPAPRSQDTT